MAIGSTGGVFVGGHDAAGPIGLDFPALRVLRYDDQGNLDWTARVAESPDHDFLGGDLQTGPDGRVSIVTTKRADPIFDEALTIHLRFAPCLGDLDGDSLVGVSDLLALLASWSSCTDCPADFDQSGTVDAVDLLMLLAVWGPCG